MKQPMNISVIIPNYNCLATLPRAIDSVRAQQVNTEIIVVDDGSTDGSRQWLAKQSDIKVIHSHRLGVSAARNLAISHCMYELVAFLDADDWWLEGKLDHQLALHQLDPTLSFSFCNYQHVTEEGESIISCFDFWPRFHAYLSKQQGHHIEPHFLPWLFAENVVGTSTVIARHDALMAVGGFDESLTSASDWDLWLKLAQCGSVGIVNRTLCHYVSNREGAISRDQPKRLAAMKTILARHASVALNSPRALLAGYNRWLLGVAEYNRCQQAYLFALFQQTIVCLVQPNRRYLKAAMSDMASLLMLKRAK
ncbi:hypothetical protein A3K86_09415 [Photobacterium jeanii]|uniref:Glycosyltransferase 2-like domain-containing protein n=1 Tax=Photobacterium jeanii TaxID=858640 RepID=A0A178KHW4_9GAMM|nr:glycosyltransferase [Photobacterium jeanii]OAN16820.1 hypothetical protein A3K86_09415 [Photobacterium jeanii]PST88429.1 glycosyl transferase [Photobacterium jeanii]